MVPPDFYQHLTLLLSDLSNKQMCNLYFGLKHSTGCMKPMAQSSNHLPGTEDSLRANLNPLLCLYLQLFLFMHSTFEVNPSFCFSWNPKCLHELLLFPEMGEKKPSSCQELQRVCNFYPTSNLTS